MRRWGEKRPRMRRDLLRMGRKECIAFSGTRKLKIANTTGMRRGRAQNEEKKATDEEMGREEGSGLGGKSAGIFPGTGSVPLNLGASL